MMNLFCCVGMHNWSKDCGKCSRCGKTRDEQYHYWSSDCEECTKCGKTRDAQHDWSKDCKKCAKCGMARDAQHDWSKDCKKCSKCGVARSKNHKWDGCKCVSCSETRNDGHDWSKDCMKCAKCGKTRDAQHDWSKDCEECTKCGKTRNKGHDWALDCGKCAKCGKTGPGAHDWSGCKCSKCGQVSPYSYHGLDISPNAAPLLNLEDFKRAIPRHCLTEISENLGMWRISEEDDFTVVFVFNMKSKMLEAFINRDTKTGLLGVGQANPETVWQSLGYSKTKTERNKVTWSNGNSTILARYYDDNSLNEVYYCAQQESIEEEVPARDTAISAAKGGFQSFDFIRKSLSGIDGCLVIRFEEKENRDNAIVILNQLRCYSHIEPIDSSWPDGVHYSRRGLGLGRYIIVVDSGYVGDTWHCAEFEHLDKTGIKFKDIDYVNYSEITGAI